MGRYRARDRSGADASGSDADACVEDVRDAADAMAADAAYDKGGATDVADDADG